MRKWEVVIRDRLEFDILVVEEFGDGVGLKKSAPGGNWENKKLGILKFPFSEKMVEAGEAESSFLKLTPIVWDSGIVCVCLLL